MLRVPKQIPKTAGVYFFSRGGKTLYIGKAENLKKRLSQYINLGNIRYCQPSAGSQGCITGLHSYFRKNVSDKTRELLQEATKLEWIETASEIEALIKEAELIKKYLPKYNVLLRDDKNYFYVGITKEAFPRIFITHQPRSPQVEFIGPFTSGSALKTTLKLLRRVFPYCTCKTPHKRPCLNAQIGRCLDFCCDKSKSQNARRKTQDAYRDNIKNVGEILRGKKAGLLTKLAGEMRRASQKQEFEQASKLRDQIAGLENVFQHAGIRNKELEMRSVRWGMIRRNIQNVLNIKRPISRVEGYDISNISGTEATGSMVVFIDGVPKKSEYRKFKIKTVHQQNDVDMLKEVIRRRMAHREWQYPDLMLIDGGKPQLNAATEIMRRKSDFPREVRLPHVTALAKREEELYTKNGGKPLPLKNLPRESAFFFQRVRDESHRFAKKYHHKLREISYREK